MSFNKVLLCLGGFISGDVSCAPVPTTMTTNGLPAFIHYHNSIKSTGNSAVYKPTSNIITAPLTEKYEVGESIGRGKFAVVKKITNRETGNVLAAKHIKKRRRGKSCREEILREVVMLEMALDHPRLVNLREVYETTHELILITEYCAGGELFTECVLEEKFTEADVRVLLCQILEGLIYLHEKKIVHLDLKPQNILLTEEFPRGSVKICDLGFACLVNTGEDIRDIIGTPDYVAPEVLNYDPLGLYTDMWSLGVLTYVMLTTCSPFAAEDKNLTFANITTCNLDFPDEMFEDISPAAVDFIKKLLILKPCERMTAVDCLNHAWITGEISVQKSLRPGPAKSDNEQAETDDNAGTSSEQSDSELTKSDPRQHKHELQTSEMSVCEEEDLVKAELNIVDSRQHGEPVCAKSEILKDSKKKGIASEGELQFNIPNMEIVLDRHVAEQTQDLFTPDSDSGMVTASDYRSESDAVPIASGRSSTDIELAGEGDLDMGYVEGTELAAHVDVIRANPDKSEDLTMEHSGSGEPGTISGGSVIHNKNFNCASDQRTASESSAMEQSDSVFEEATTVNHNSDIASIPEETSTSVSKNEIEMDESESSKEDSGFLTVTALAPDTKEGNNDVSDLEENRGRQIFQDIQKSFTHLPAQERPVKGRASLGSINETIHGMNIGEKHKRAMSSEPSTSTGNPGENEEEVDYEFISVSKRVRSIEENLNVTPPYSPKIAHSPKIARSPRIARHSRSHHHH